ncbi:MAG TPA: maltose alpha-D-glucosyltransferase [Anaerolineaceae bacterium]|nr:maltose alpha-D-glucosyltransferase [Anaerolineaceae bacterium]
MAWYHNAIFYEVSIRGYSDANGDGIGDLAGLTARLDYIAQLGVDCIWLLPMYPSPLVDDGYDIADYYGIHPDFGALEDFKTLIREAHARGLKVITDLVLNHTSDQHMWFQASRASKSSPYRDYYVWSPTNQRYLDARIIFIDTQTSNWEFDERAGEYFWHRFYPQQPDLNFDNPAVRGAMIDVMRFWLDLGLDGFRADAVPYLFEREGTNCENLPETHDYLRRIRREIETARPDAILLGEANQWPQDVRPYFGNGDEMHMNFHFPLMPRIYLALARADSTPIVDILKATPRIPENAQWCTFLRNHDELTLEMVTPEERDEMWRIYAPQPRMRLNLGIRRRLAPLLDGDRRKIELANSLLFSLPGSPIVYYGDEIGMGDNIWMDDRNGVRTPMQWNAGNNAGFSAAPADKLYARPITDPIYGYQKVNVASQQADPESLLQAMRKLIALRKAHPVFATGELQFVEGANKSVLAFLRTSAEETILAAHNLSDQSQPFGFDLPQGKTTATDLRTEERLRVEGSHLNLDLEPYASLWIKLS